jgi:hypothetical protein
MVCAETEGDPMMFYQWSSPALIVFAILSCGCERSDPLSAVPNRTGTAVLEDILIGSDSRAICVTATTREACNSRQSEIYIEDIDSLNDVRAKWADDDLVVVEVTSGVVRRSSDKSRNGLISIRLNLNAPAPKIMINHPTGNDSIPLPSSNPRQ